MRDASRIDRTRERAADIRLATPADAAALAAIYAPFVTDGVISFEFEAPDEAEMTRRLERVTAWTPWLVCDYHGATVGYAYAGRHRERAAYQWSVDVSVYVRHDAHRAGIARGLYTSLFAILVRQGFRNAYAGITLPNPPSEGFHRAMGFRAVGVYHGVGHKMGRWHDVGWYERELAPRIADPPPPMPFAAVRDTPAVRAAVRSGLPVVGARGGGARDDTNATVAPDGAREG
ncbi:MAG TPA: GNAT family N-acetyltransferase [Gemmatimonadaceae bacterium]